MMSSLQRVPERNRWTRRLRAMFVPVILVLAATVLGLIAIAGHGKALSPIDEWVYLDYLDKVPSQGFVRQGEPIGEPALNWIACNGIQGNADIAPGCDLDHSDRSPFPFSGYQTAYLYTPLYLAPTWAAATAIQHVTSLNFLDAARVTGIGWLVLTVLAIYALLRMFEVRRTSILAVGLVFIASPYVWWNYTFVTTEAPTVLLGALALIGVEGIARARLNAWWLVPFATVAILIKSTNAVVIGLMLLFAALRFIGSHSRGEPWFARSAWRAGIRGRGPAALIIGPVVATAVALVSQFAWLRFVAAQAVGEVPPIEEHIRLSFGTMLAQAENFIPNVLMGSAPRMPGISNSFEFFPLIATVLGWLCLAGVLGSVLINRERGARAHAVTAIAIAGLLAGPALSIVLSFSLGTVFALPARYAGGLVAGFLLCIALLTSRRRIRIGLLAFAIVLYVYVLACGIAA